jgi:hypothetical protein
VIYSLIVVAGAAQKISHSASSTSGDREEGWEETSQVVDVREVSEALEKE